MREGAFSLVSFTVLKWLCPVARVWCEASPGLTADQVQPGSVQTLFRTVSMSAMSSLYRFVVGLKLSRFQLWQLLRG